MQIALRLAFVAVLISLPLATSLPGAVSGAVAKSHYVLVAAGPWDRYGTIVSFNLPAALPGKSYVLRDAGGQVTRLQVDAENRATFILRELKAGATGIYRLEASGKEAASNDRVDVAREKDAVRITIAGRPALRYQGGKGELPRADIKPIFRRGGYIHPVHTPGGRVITDDYPPNHLHHHGIWFPWTKTEFEGRKPDFWNMGDGTGTVEFQSLDDTTSGPVYGSFKARHRFIDLSAPETRAALNEVWEVTAYKAGQARRPYFVFDLVSVQECASASPLILPEYHYGGMGFRGHRQWDGKDNAIFLTSEGKDRSNGHATRARWCHIGGRVDGELAGIAILGHPENFRAPQPMRIHPTEPFFCFAPSQLGGWEIAPGRPYVSRYRYIVYDGPPDATETERMWRDYADPPGVKIEYR